MRSTVKNKSQSKKAKPKKGTAPPFSVPTQNRLVLQVPAKDIEDAYKETARLYGLPEVQAGKMLLAFQPDSGLDLQQVALDLRKSFATVNGGDLTKAENMLLAQAQTLEVIFADLACRAKLQTDLHVLDGLLRLALKAQSQSRATIQTLVEVKFPRQIQFVKQQNIAGNQQVNNGTAPGAELQRGREEKRIEPTKLLEGATVERLDEGTQRETIPAHPKLAAVA